MYFSKKNLHNGVDFKLKSYCSVFLQIFPFSFYHKTKKKHIKLMIFGIFILSLRSYFEIEKFPE